MTAVPAPLASAGAEVRAPAPITSAGVATHAAGWIPPRLSANSLRPYVGILGVLIGAILSFVGSRITTFGLADLRGGLHFGFDEGAWMTTSFGVGQMMVGVACPYLGAIFSVRQILLHGMALLIHRQPARTAVAQSHRLPHRAISRRRGLGDVHPAHHRLHRPQSAAAPDRLRSRRLRDELRAVAERLGLARGLVHGKLVMALDRMAKLRGAAAHVRLHLVRSAAREDQHRAAAPPRLARARLCRRRFRASLCRPRPGQPARLEQQRSRQWPVAFGRIAHARLRRAGALDREAVPQSSAAREGRACADPAPARRLPLHHSLDRLHHPDLSSGRAELSRAAGRRRAHMDRAAAVSDRHSSRLASFPCRRALGPCGRRDPDRNRLADGNRSHAGLGHRRLSSLSGLAGRRAVVRVDGGRRSRGSIDESRRCA